MDILRKNVSILLLCNNSSNVKEKIKTIEGRHMYYIDKIFIFQSDRFVLLRNLPVVVPNIKNNIFIN